MDEKRDTIVTRFFQSAERFPDKQAIFCDGTELTYAELADLSCRYANYLKKRGVVYEDVVGIPMTNSIESVALMLAAAMLGVALAPVNPTLPVDDVDIAFRSVGVKHIVARKAFFRSIAGYDFSYLTGCKLCLDGEIAGTDSFVNVLSEKPQKPDVSKITGEELFFLTLTSGSTGNPKPIELSQRNKLMRAETHAALYNVTPKDRVLAATPLYHSLAERLVLMPLLIGATSVLLPRFTPAIWLQCVHEQKVTFTIAVSAQLSQIAQLLSSPFLPELSSLRMVVSSSSLLESHVRNELIDKLQCDFHEIYGTSECSTVTDIDFRMSAEKKQSVGRPLPDVEVKILDNDMQVCKTGEVGEIAVSTPLKCVGYYGLPEKMKQATYQGYFLTGDLGRLDEAGYLYFMGRKKELIITGGVNIYPQDIEKKVSEMEGIRECAAFPLFDERLGEVVALAIVKDLNINITQRAVRVYCAKALADFQQPHKIFFLDELPKNSMGKITKKELPRIVAGIEG